jgi:hypothetical protein
MGVIATRCGGWLWMLDNQFGFGLILVLRMEL